MAILLLAIFGPGAVAVTITRYLDYKVRDRPSWIQTFSFDHRSLFKQPWFWLISISGLLYTLVFMGIAVFDRKVLLSAEGFRTFIEDASLSLGILSAFSLLLALISRIHASFQQETQIKEAQKKNDADIYLLYKNDFTKEATDLLFTVDYAQFLLLSDAKISSKFFDNSRKYDQITGKFDIKESYIDEITSKLISLAQSIRKLRNESDDIKLMNGIFENNELEYFLYAELGLNSYMRRHEYNGKSVTYETSNGNIRTSLLLFDSQKWTYSWLFLYQIYSELLKLKLDLKDSKSSDLLVEWTCLKTEKEEHGRINLRIDKVLSKYEKSKVQTQIEKHRENQK